MSLLGTVSKEAQLARQELREGRFQRSLALLAATSAAVSGFEAYVQHQRGDFNDRWMWTPIWLTPPTVVAGIATIFSKRAGKTLLPAVSLASLADGFVGFWYHIQGIRRLPGGFRLGQYNIVMGPPVFAPLLLGIVGVTGLIASMLRRESPKPKPSLMPIGRSRLQRDISHGRFQQGMALTSAAFAVLAGGEAYFEHLRGSYNDPLMWTPVYVTPPMAGAAVAAAVSGRVARGVLPIASAVTFLDGMLGFFLHLRGLYRMPGRLHNLRFNITMGPPLFAPLLFTAVGLLGMIASLLRRER
jgi:hypothetical protein